MITTTTEAASVKDTRSEHLCRAKGEKLLSGRIIS